MGWPSWLLLSFVLLLAALALAAHLLRFRYAFEYVFPDLFQGHIAIAFLGRRKVIPFGALLEEHEEDFPEDARAAASDSPAAADDSAPTAASGDFPGPEGPGSGRPPGPRPGQEGFLSVPWADRMERFRRRHRAAALKWALDLPVWRLLARFTLRTGFSTLRLIGPSMEHLHVGAADVSALGRFAAWWSTLAGLFPFLACPVEYGFNERPFALRLKVSGGCTALGAIGFALAWVFSIPWRALFRRYLHCWRDPRLNRVQRRLLRLAA